MYDLIKEAIVDDDAAIELSKMDKNVVEVVDAISELSLEDTMKLGMKFKRFPLGCDLTEAVVGTFGINGITWKLPFIRYVGIAYSYLRICICRYC